jgi:transposase
MKNIFIGCDISKAKIDFCILSLDKNKNASYYGQFENSQVGFDVFIKTIAVQYPFTNPIIGFESTGSYGLSFQKYLSDNGILYKMFNPRKISKYIKSLDIQGKTDKSDSYAIAHYCSIQDINTFDSSYFVQREIFIKYTTTLRQITKIKVQINNLKKSISYGVVDDDLISALHMILIDFKKHEKNLRKKAIELLKIYYPVCDVLNDKYSGLSYRLLLLLVPRVYDTIENYTVNQTVAFLGFNPVPFESGQIKLKDRLNMFGDKELKRLLYLAALSSVSFNKVLKEKHKRNIENGKSKKLSLMIISRKILVLLIRDMKRYKVENGS